MLLPDPVGWVTCQIVSTTTVIYLIVEVLLYSIVVSDINLIQIDGIKNIVPHIVVFGNVILKAL